jgi:ubiquinone biosynthesis accessory factor UbiJ
MLNVIMIAAIEDGLNKLLLLEPSLGAALTEQKHKMLAVEIRDVSHTCAIVFTGSKFTVFSDYKEHSDCLISANINTLTQLQTPSNLTQFIRQDKLDLQGDLHLAQAYSQTFSQLNIDWAEHFSKFLGDSVAQSLVNTLQSLQLSTKEQLKVGQTTLTQLFQDELKVAIHPLEMEEFKEKNRELKQCIAQLEQRINLLTRY